MSDVDLVIQLLQAQRNDAHNINVNLMLENSKLKTKVAELEASLKEPQGIEEDKHGNV